MMDKVRSLTVLWPAFFAAAVIEMVVFAFVDPGDLHWLGGMAVEWSRQSVYTIAFFLFWAVVAAAGFTMMFLCRAAADINMPKPT